MALINMIHPELPPAPASLQEEDVFEAIWKGKGWKHISAEEAVIHNAALENGDPSPVLNPAKKAGDK